MNENRNTLDASELALFGGIAATYGYDFRDYFVASLRRRLAQWLGRSGYATAGEAAPHVLGDRRVFQGLLDELTVQVTEMFRDPLYFATLRREVVPHLSTHPFVKIWHPGCSSGEEAYSMAILLSEEGLGDRFRIYATDISQRALGVAQAGVYSLAATQRNTRNYQLSGGRRAFCDYYSAQGDCVHMRPSLARHIVFAHHNIAVDQVFGEMQLVVCRNVLIYFQRPLHERTFALFDAALAPGGFLFLGAKESLEGAGMERHYDEIAPHTRIYRKRYA